MIQRIQSIWLLLASVLAFAGLTLPFYSGVNVSGELQYTLKGTENLGFQVLTITVGLLALIAIFIYKNRKTQTRMVLAAVVLQLGLTYLYYHYTKTIFINSPYNTFALWSVFQPLVLIFLILAMLGIRRDSKIIADSNRLR